MWQVKKRSEEINASFYVFFLLNTQSPETESQAKKRIIQSCRLDPEFLDNGLLSTKHGLFRN